MPLSSCKPPGEDQVHLHLPSPPIHALVMLHKAEPPNGAKCESRDSVCRVIFLSVYDLSC